MSALEWWWLPPVVALLGPLVAVAVIWGFEFYYSTPESRAWEKLGRRGRHSRGVSRDSGGVGMPVE